MLAAAGVSAVSDAEPEESAELLELWLHAAEPQADLQSRGGRMFRHMLSAERTAEACSLQVHNLPTPATLAALHHWSRSEY